jgi:hypothetical protein
MWRIYSNPDPHGEIVVNGIPVNFTYCFILIVVNEYEAICKTDRKTPPCSKALSAEHRPKFAALSPVMVTAAR